MNKKGESTLKKYENLLRVKKLNYNHMRKLITLLLLVFFIIVSYKANKESKINHQSFWYNVGIQIKKMPIVIYHKVELIAYDIGSGLKE